MKPYVVRGCALWLAALLLSGCQSTTSEEPASYRLITDTTTATNGGAPLKVRVFLLQSDADFMSADFYSLQNNATAVLGNNLIDSSQFFLTQQQPRQTRQDRVPANARYLAIMGEYQTLDKKTWRLSLPLPTPKRPHFYQFWSSASEELRAHIVATANGLSARQDDD